MRSILLVAALLIAGAAPVAADTTYTYDDLGRLVKVCYDNGKQIEYKYDQAGNRSQVLVESTCS